MKKDSIGKILSGEECTELFQLITFVLLEDAIMKLDWLSSSLAKEDYYRTSLHVIQLIRCLLTCNIPIPPHVLAELEKMDIPYMFFLDDKK